MISARSMVLSFCASVAALAALALSAQAMSPGSVARSAIDASFASNHVFQNTTSLNFASYTGSKAAAAVPFVGEAGTAEAPGAQGAILRVAAQSGVRDKSGSVRGRRDFAGAGRRLSIAPGKARSRQR